MQSNVRSQMLKYTLGRRCLYCASKEPWLTDRDLHSPLEWVHSPLSVKAAGRLAHTVPPTHETTSRLGDTDIFRLA